MDQRAERLKELMNDESFVKEFITKQSPEDVQAFLEANGVELSLDEVRQIGSLLEKVASGEITDDELIKASNGELSEDELADVAGGEVLVTMAALTGIIVTGVVSGAVITTAAIAITHYKNEIRDWFRSW